MSHNLTSLLLFLEHRKLDKHIQTIIEIGARDCTETLLFNEAFPEANIFTFECNPETLPICRQKVMNHKSIELIEKAVVSEDLTGFATFYQIDTQATRTTWADGNPGASSLLKTTGTYPIEEYIQKPIKVPSITLKRFFEDKSFFTIDLLWMDIQGAELMALEGAKEHLEKIGIIHTEVAFFDIYENQPRFTLLKNFLNQKGFDAVDFTHFGAYSADCIFINRRLSMPWLRKMIFRMRNHFIINLQQMRGYKMRLQQLVNSGFSHRYWFRFFLKRRSFEIVLEKSSISIEVVISCTEKHIKTLPYVVKAIRQFVLHPIEKITIVGDTQNIDLLKICRELNVDFFDEKDALPIQLSHINYNPSGFHRTNWIYQQLIKLNVDHFTHADNVLVCDADLVLTQPQSFITANGKTIFRCSDEYHLPYQVFQKILGIRGRYAASFVSHHIVFNSKRLKEMKKLIELLHGQVWYDVILSHLDSVEPSSFSEYETYGNFMAKCYPQEMSTIYWHHKILNEKDLKDIEAWQQPQWLSAGLPFIKS